MDLSEIIQPIISDIQKGKKTIEVSELWGASKALFLFALMQALDRPLLIVTATEDEAEALVEDLYFFVGKQELINASTAVRGSIEISLFPAWGVLPFEADSPDSR